MRPLDAARPRSRPIAIALTVGAALLAVPAAAPAAQIFGSRLEHAPANSGECANFFGAACTIASYVVPHDGVLDSGGAPSDGVITAFRVRAQAEAATQIAFRIVDPISPAADQKTATATAVANGPTVTLQPTAAGAEPGIQAFPARVPVRKGQHLALEGANFEATYNSGGEKFSYAFSPPLTLNQPQVGQSTGELLVQATLEPDADGDGFGDESQDRCPSQAATQGECDRTKPAVKLRVSKGRVDYTLSEPATVRFGLTKKRPGRRLGRKCVAPTRRNRTKSRCARFVAVGHAFGGPGRAGANRVTLPNLRRLGPGEYRLTLTATDEAGNEATQTTRFAIAPRPTR